MTTSKAALAELAMRIKLDEELFRHLPAEHGRYISQSRLEDMFEALVGAIAQHHDVTRAIAWVTDVARDLVCAKLPHCIARAGGRSLLDPSADPGPSKRSLRASARLGKHRGKHDPNTPSSHLNDDRVKKKLRMAGSIERLEAECRRLGQTLTFVLVAQLSPAVVLEGVRIQGHVIATARGPNRQSARIEACENALLLQTEWARASPPDPIARLGHPSSNSFESMCGAAQKAGQA